MERTMPAAALRAVLTDPQIQIDPGGIQIRGARFADHVDLEYLVFAYPLRLYECVLEQGLNANYAQIRGLTLAEVTVNHGVLAKGATIGGELDLTGTTLINPDSNALDLEGACVTGNVVAAGDFHATGMIWATGATVGGDLILTGATLVNPATKENPERYALVLDGARITGSMFGRNPFCVTGAVSAIGVTIGSTLELDGATFNNPDGDALGLSRAHITTDVFAQNGFRAIGTVRAIGAIIGGHIHLDGASLYNPATEKNPDRYALVLDAAQITGNVFAGEYAEANSETRKFHATGMVRARGVTIGGELDVTGATFECPGTAGKLGKAALDLGGARITGSVLAGEGADKEKRPCHVEGTVRAIGATIGAQLDLSGATVNNPDGVALNLEAATVSRLILTPKEWCGSVNLVRAQVSDLEVGRVVDGAYQIPPNPLSATGWQVDDLRGPLRERWRLAHQWLNTASAHSEPKTSGSRAWRRRLVEWLRPKKPVPVQPWYALAEVYDRNGDPTGAKRLRFAAANKVSRQSPLPTRVLRSLYRVLVGHGYYPLRAGLWLAGVLLVATFIVATNRADFVPTKSDAAAKAADAYTAQTHKPAPSRITALESCDLRLAYPCLNPFTYTMSAVVPNFGNMTSDWTIPSDATNWLTIALPMLKLTAWALTALLGAGVTGILRKT
ncbi:hypothetical protein A5704_08305 [Mycobacterium sp. E735]|nr:hypothetical protein A5704_08305 [Mycobacterium sp. E735]